MSKQSTQRQHRNDLLREAADLLRDAQRKVELAMAFEKDAGYQNDLVDLVTEVDTARRHVLTFAA